VSTRRVFLGAQVVVSMVLLAGCAVFLRSLQHASAIDPGFDPAGVVATAVDTRASSAGTDRTFWTRLVDEIRRLPSVESASLTSRLPLELGIVMTSLAPEGFVPADGAAWPSVEFAVVDTGYFDTMRIPLVDGRDFTPRDADGFPAVAVVNDVLARQFWGDVSAIGRRLVTRDGGRLQVVGVVRHSKYLSIGESPKPYVHFPLRQGHADAMTIVARGSGDSASLLRAIGSEVRRLDPEAPLYEVTTMSRKVAMSLAPARGGALALGIVAAIAIGLTALGLFGSVAQAVSRRTYEIGVRRALGAPDRSVVWLMVGDTMGPVAIGSALGLAIAIAAQPVLRAVLYDVTLFDPVVVGLAPAVVVLVCATAAWLPSRRATRISATAALRCE
jgi:predicted permease